MSEKSPPISPSACMLSYRGGATFQRWRGGTAPTPPRASMSGLCTCVIAQPAARIGIANFHTPLCGIHGGCPPVGEPAAWNPAGLFFAQRSAAQVDASAITSRVQQALSFAKGLTQPANNAL